MLCTIGITIAAIALSIYVFWKWFSSNYDYFDKIGINYKAPLKSMYQYSIRELGLEMYNACPNDRLCGAFNIRTLVYLLRDPELIKQLAIKDFDHFEDHQMRMSPHDDDLMGNGLIFLAGEKWRDMRATLSPAFTGSKMRQMYELIMEITDEFVKHLSKQAKNGKALNWDMTELFATFTNDVIATCAFGHKVNSLEDNKNEFLLCAKKSNQATFSPYFPMKFFLTNQFPTLSRLLGISLVDKKVASFFKSMVLDTMAEREKRNIFRPDLINILMQVRKGGAQAETVTDTGSDMVDPHLQKRTVKRQWTDNEMVAQCLLFFGAGFQTTSGMLAFAAYELAIHPDIQDTLYDEIVSVQNDLNGNVVNYETLHKMKYLDQVLMETLRRWPVLAVTDRACVKDYSFDLDGRKIYVKKGEGIVIPIYGLHFDPKYHPNPDKFDPERFNDENKKDIIPGTFLPFGIGPRNCIGSRFAIMEIKALLYHLLLNFKLEPNEKTEIPLKIKKSLVGTSPENGIFLELKPRADL